MLSAWLYIAGLGISSATIQTGNQPFPVPSIPPNVGQAINSAMNRLMPSIDVINDYLDQLRRDNPELQSVIPSITFNPNPDPPPSDNTPRSSIERLSESSQARGSNSKPSPNPNTVQISAARAAIPISEPEYVVNQPANPGGPTFISEYEEPDLIRYIDPKTGEIRTMREPTEPPEPEYIMGPNGRMIEYEEPDRPDIIYIQQPPANGGTATNPPPPPATGTSPSAPAPPAQSPPPPPPPAGGQTTSGGPVYIYDPARAVAPNMIVGEPEYIINQPAGNGGGAGGAAGGPIYITEYEQPDYVFMGGGQGVGGGVGTTVGGGGGGVGGATPNIQYFHEPEEPEYVMRNGRLMEYEEPEYYILGGGQGGGGGVATPAAPAPPAQRNGGPIYMFDPARAVTPNLIPADPEYVVNTPKNGGPTTVSEVEEPEYVQFYDPKTGKMQIIQKPTEKPEIDYIMKNGRLTEYEEPDKYVMGPNGRLVEYEEPDTPDVIVIHQPPPPANAPGAATGGAKPPPPPPNAPPPNSPSVFV